MRGPSLGLVGSGRKVEKSLGSIKALGGYGTGTVGAKIRTWTNAPLGRPAPNRQIIVMAASRFTQISYYHESITVRGIPAIKITANPHGVSGWYPKTSIWIADVPEGDTGDISLVNSTGDYGGIIAAYASYDSPILESISGDSTVSISGYNRGSYIATAVGGRQLSDHALTADYQVEDFTDGFRGSGHGKLANPTTFSATMDGNYKPLPVSMIALQGRFPDIFDDFNRDDGPLGDFWASVGTASQPTISSNRAVYPGAQARARHVTPLSNDHYVQVVRSPQIDVRVGGLIARVSESENTFYLVNYYNGSITIIRFVNGVSTTIGEVAVGGGSNSLIRLEAKGSKLSLFFNWTKVLEVTDTNPLSGPYVGISNQGYGSIIDDFEAGSL